MLFQPPAAVSGIASADSFGPVTLDYSSLAPYISSVLLLLLLY